MISFSGSAVYNQHGVIEGYEINAVKSNGQPVFFVTGVDLVSELGKKVEAFVTPEEKKEQIVQEVIQKKIDESVDNIEEVKDLIQRWSVGASYKKGEIATYNDEVYKAKANTIANYEEIPVNSPDLWEKLEKKPSVAAGGFEMEKAIYDQKFKEADFFSRDKSYKLGDHVKHYNKLYRSLASNNTDTPGAETSSKWELVPEPKQS